MLFQRLYNWIKYKTLPPSFLFKNRLFIERDSKHKRILTNFGLTFRNSKWSGYQNYNIKINFKNNYLHFFFWILGFAIAAFFLYNFKSYYAHHYLFNSISFIFWISADSFDYYLSYLVWVTGVIATFVFNSIYSYFFFNNFSEKKILLKKKNSFFSNLKINEKNLSLSKHDLNWLSYSWFTNNKSKINFETNNKIIEKLFENSVNKNLWNNYYDFFIKLYKLTYFFNLLDKKNNIFFLSKKLSDISYSSEKNIEKNLIFFLNNEKHLNNFCSLIFYYFINSNENYFSKKNNSYSNNPLNSTRYEWNLQTINKQLNKYPFLTNTKLGFFFIDTLNQNKLLNLNLLNNEFKSLNFFILEQTKAAKINRWLYKYSILHRKILKNSHKITLSKRILNLNLFSKNDFNKNLWNAEYFSKIIDNKQIFNSFFNVCYLNNRLDETKLNNYNLFIDNKINNRNSFKFLNFYENSYFWFLKRFFIFNTLPSNSVKSKKINKNFEYTKNVDFLTNYFMLNNFILKTYNFSFKNFMKNDIVFKNYTLKKKINSSKNDLYLLFLETDLLTKDNLNILTNLTSINLSKKKNPLFFNYLNNNFLPVKNNQKFNKNNNIFYLNNLNHYLFLSLINSEVYYIKDLEYLSLFK